MAVGVVDDLNDVVAATSPIAKADRAIDPVRLYSATF